MKLKNYVKTGQKLPLFGVGPYLIYGIGLLTALFIVLFGYVLRIGILDGIWVWVFRSIGGVLMILGAVIWYIGALRSGMDESITENKLKTTGIYSWVRNPMYSGWWIALTGISLMWHNIFLIPVFFLNWAIITLVLINTEEKWLLNLYGEEYSNYKKRVNRCIPWKRR
ncbi:Protein-S-isoprenylcysteine O-methyltransferase Ste14 [Ruminococcaceae bacterium YRB3002]|jgi:protein-S-isoprenylcysteine O-methyltransferase Ste14|nr:Protein-S-isoprenylcysteine O-methyltransferase Ste14 [Ruminococcaceae bacterium YRB3002]